MFVLRLFTVCRLISITCLRSFVNGASHLPPPTKHRLAPVALAVLATQRPCMWPSLLAALLAQSGTPLDDRLGVGSTLYDALGVTHDCTQAAIKAAYRRCALQHHPDKVRGSVEKRDAQRRFERINDAYSTLMDPASRQQYNSELLGRSFGAAPRQHRHTARAAQPRSVVRLSVRCTLEELGGWSAVCVDASSVLGAPHPPIRYWLPPGCVARDRVKLPLYGGVDLELDLDAAPHAAFERHSEDADVLFGTQLLPAYHNLLPPYLRRRLRVRTVSHPALRPHAPRLQPQLPRVQLQPHAPRQPRVAGLPQP